MARRPRSRASGRTWGSSLKTRETVFWLTLAGAATSRMVVISGLLLSRADSVTH